MARLRCEKGGGFGGVGLEGGGGGGEEGGWGGMGWYSMVWCGGSGGRGRGRERDYVWSGMKAGGLCVRSGWRGGVERIRKDVAIERGTEEGLGV